MSKVTIKYKEDNRPIDRVEMSNNNTNSGRLAAHKRNGSVIIERGGNVQGYSAGDVIEFAEALIKLAKQVKNP